MYNTSGRLEKQGRQEKQSDLICFEGKLRCGVSFLYPFNCFLSCFRFMLALQESRGLNIIVYIQSMCIQSMSKVYKM